MIRRAQAEHAARRLHAALEEHGGGCHCRPCDAVRPVASWLVDLLRQPAVPA